MPALGAGAGGEPPHATSSPNAAQQHKRTSRTAARLCFPVTEQSIAPRRPCEGSSAPSTSTSRSIARQQLRERLFVEGKITQYSGRGALTSWLRVVTVRAASNLRRQDRPHADIDEVVLGTAIDPELDVIRRRYGDTFRTALRDAIAGLDADDRNLIRLHYIDGLNIERIAVVFRVSRATIGRRMIAVRERILGETNRLLRERLNATPSELDSLLRVVRSHLGMSLSDALREP